MVKVEDVELFKRADQVDAVFWGDLERLDPAAVVARCGARHRQGAYALDMLGEPFLVDPARRLFLAPARARAEEVSFQEGLVLMTCLIHPGPGGLSGQRVSPKALPGGALLGGDRLTATLALPCEPLSTNGRWKADEHRVEWAATLVPNDKPDESSLQQPLPDLLFAIWVEPAAQVQSGHFGKVALDGTQLVVYCLWRCGLPEEKARLWEAFLGGLKPGADLSKRIGEFRFPDEPQDGETRSAAREIREMLVSGIK